MQTACRCEDCGVPLPSLYSIYSTSQSSTVQYDKSTVQYSKQCRHGAKAAVQWMRLALDLPGRHHCHLLSSNHTSTSRFLQIRPDGSPASIGVLVWPL
jgi:hypothetical protein